MIRITRTQLDAAVDMLNRMTNSPDEPYRKEGDRWIANIGNFHVSGAYGGYALHRMCTDGGGVRDVFSSGHMPARELFGLIHAFRRGIELAREEATA